mmetsp:Transcript_3486/g.6356  ORF Transcript_3486/g.6356 Transcript_3486/m.6356 type:complete len:240 (+) Transcript_3486:78-797(+)
MRPCCQIDASLGSDVERGSKHDVAPDRLCALAELGSELFVADRARRVLQLPHQLIQPPGGADDGALKDVRHVADLLEGGALGPVVDDVHQARLEALHKILHLDLDLLLVTDLGDEAGGALQVAQRHGEVRLELNLFVALFDRHEAARERDELVLVEPVEHAVEHQLRRQQLIRCVNLTRRPSLQQHRPVLVHVLQPTQHRLPSLRLLLERRQLTLPQLLPQRVRVPLQPRLLVKQVQRV